MSVTSDKYLPLKNICIIYLDIMFTYFINSTSLDISCSTCRETKILPVSTKKKKKYILYWKGFGKEYI